MLLRRGRKKREFVIFIKALCQNNLALPRLIASLASNVYTLWRRPALLSDKVNW